MNMTKMISTELEKGKIKLFKNRYDSTDKYK